MKKGDDEARERIRLYNLRQRKEGERIAARARRRLHERRSKGLDFPDEYDQIWSRRARLRKKIYAKRKYTGRAKVVTINQQLGLEEQPSIAEFLDVAEQLTEFDGQSLLLDLSHCPRVWPSGVTLLCSLAKWVELTAVESHTPTIHSTRPLSEPVHSYLAHCGFYDFVSRRKDGTENPELFFSDDSVVKIQRETTAISIEAREDGIISLLRTHSHLGEEELALFDAKVLTEVFNNVTEHGEVRKGEQGWWVLAQHHPRHHLISVCIADNGIGLRNTLLTGPQRDDILRRLSNDAGDGEFIRLALEESVSGALDAPQKTERRTRSKLSGGLIQPLYKRGAHRGNGLRRIRETCKKLGISFSITSHYGYARVDELGAVSAVISREHRLLGGAMYHFIVPCNGGQRWQ